MLGSAMRSLRPVLWRTSVACALALAVTQVRGEADTVPLESGRSLQDVLGLSGSLRAADFSRDTSFGDETGYAVASVWATAAPPEFWGIKTYFDARAQAQDLTRDSDVSWEMR